jgi:predicted DNA-binding ribbon-helix-helix protein
MPRSARSHLINRKVVSTHRRTGMRLEPEFWEARDEICWIEKVDRNALVRRIESAAPATMRTSAIRVFILQHIRQRERAAAHRLALQSIMADA